MHRNVGLLAIGFAVGALLASETGPARAAPLGATAVAPSIASSDIVVAGYRRYYEDFDDDVVIYDAPPPRYYRPPPTPIEVYEYEPPVYGWSPPPRPSSCGKYRYWDGEACVDARFYPPYTGPRW